MVSNEILNRYLASLSEWAETTLDMRRRVCRMGGDARWQPSVETPGWWCCEICGRTSTERVDECYPLLVDGPRDEP